VTFLNLVPTGVELGGFEPPTSWVGFAVARLSIFEAFF
jgi:hypothetical protein